MEFSHRDAFPKHHPQLCVDAHNMQMASAFPFGRTPFYL